MYKGVAIRSGPSTRKSVSRHAVGAAGRAGTGAALVSPRPTEARTALTSGAPARGAAAARGPSARGAPNCLLWKGYT